jgi:extracellular elastinolytic metalloproteinase
MKNSTFTTLLLVVSSLSLFAQKPFNTPKPHPDAVNIALNFLKSQQAVGILSDQDVAHVLVQDHFVTDDNGLTHVTLVQRHADIELFNGIATVTVLPSGAVLHGVVRFVPKLAGKVNATKPAITPEAAVQYALDALKTGNTEGVVLKEKINAHTFIFNKNSQIRSETTVKLKFFAQNDTMAKLCWDLNLDDGHETWSYRVDALTGAILDRTSWTQHCEATTPQYRIETGVENTFGTQEDCAPLILDTPTDASITLNPPVLNGGTYNIFPLPIENPNQGSRSLLVAPFDTQASPFGWHDTNGAAGAEHTITRGNNTHAYLDWRDTNSSAADEPNGGSNLIFDFPFDPVKEPDSNRQAAITNLFYTTNRMHDITVAYGFNEAAGNFQQRNYSGVVGGLDALVAQGQDGAKSASPRRNNANFTTFPDGSPSRLQMFVWSEYKEKLISITAPASVAAPIETSFATFGGLITTTPVSGIAEVVFDSTTNPTLGCFPLRNSNLTGKIAIVDRGTCGFDQKALNAQRRGAVGICVCFLDEQLSTIMGVNTASVASQVTIPLVAVRRSDCARLKALAAAGNLRLSIGRQEVFTPELVDGCFDNGVVAHEFGHGISNRLTGGRLNVDCLSDCELKAGEGWSDFFALAVTAKPNDRNTTRRTVGTYLARQNVNGKGFRAYPYTTDFTVNPHTYDDIILDDDVHNIGEVWGSTLWDLYWAMIDLYGFSADLKNLNSGNGRTIKLVMDALKIQGCNPGFLDARNAILKADSANYNGIHNCLIWDVFARRGLGFNAQQGTAKSAQDNTEGFERMPLCVKRLKINKSATESVRSGEQITYTITVINHKDAAVSGVVVTDTLPTGTTFVANSNNRPYSQSGQILTFNLGTINTRDTVVIMYKATTDPNRKSLARFFDDMEKTDSLWSVASLVTNTNRWALSDVDRRSGQKSFFVGYPTNGLADQVLQTKNAVTIPTNWTQPVLRFFHRYDTEPAQDGAFVEFSTNGGTTWQDLGSRFFKNPYRGRMDFRTFGIPEQRAWYGKSSGWIASVADLTALKGQSVRFRFRFGIDSTDLGVGWYVDDVAVMDMVNYTTRARVSSTQGDLEEAELAARGTIVEPTLITSNKEITEGGVLQLFPNPTSNTLTINASGLKSTQDAELTIFAADGRLVWQSRQILAGASELVLPVDVSNFAVGLYVVRLSVEGKMSLAKFIKQ